MYTRLIHKGGAYTRGLYTKEGLIHAAYTLKRSLYARLIHIGEAYTRGLYTKEGLVHAAYTQRRGVYTRIIHKGGAYIRGLYTKKGFIHAAYTQRRDYSYYIFICALLQENSPPQVRRGSYVHYSSLTMLHGQGERFSPTASGPPYSHLFTNTWMH